MTCLSKKARTDHEPRATSHGSSGFTLIEVLIAIVILASGLTIVLGSMTATEKAARVSENMVLASVLAENRMAESEMDVRAYHELNSGTETIRERRPGREYTISRVIGPYTHPTILDETRLNKVETTVQWREGARGINSLILSELILNEDKQKKIL